MSRTKITVRIAITFIVLAAWSALLVAMDSGSSTAVNPTSGTGSPGHSATTAKP